MVKFQKGCFRIKTKGKNVKLNNHKKKDNLELSKEIDIKKASFIEENVLNLLKKNNISGK